MLSIFSVILRHKRFIVLATVAGFVVSAIVSLILPPRYVSVVAFLPIGVEQEITGKKGFFSRLGAFGEAYATVLRVRRNFVIDFMVRSRRMSDLMKDRFDLEAVYGVDGSEEVRKELRERTSVEVRDEGVIILGVQDRRPERARDLAQTYIHFVDSLLIEFTSEHSTGRKNFLEAEIERREERIASADSALRAFLVAHGVFEVGEQARAAIEVAARLEARINMLQIENEMLGMTLQPGSPELARAERLLDKMREQVEEMRTGEGSELFPSLSEVPDLTAEYLRRYADIKIQEFALSYLSLKLEDEEILTNRDVSVIRIIDPPVVPEKRAWPKRKQIVLFTTAAVFLWACFGVLVRERWGEVRGL